MRKFHLAIILLSLGFMATVLATQWNKIQSLEWSIQPELLILSLLAIVIIFFLDAYGWHLILRTLGVEIPVSRSITIWLTSSLSRYIPGVVWSYASRVSLAKNEGIGAALSGLSLYLETFLLMASSLAVGLPPLLMAAGLPINPISALLLLIGFGLLLHPSVISRLKLLPGKAGKLFSGLQPPALRLMLALYLYYILFWVLFGAAFLCFVLSLYPLPYENWIPVGASIAMGFFAGFIFVIFPGGIGVRESALYLLLSPLLPTTVNVLVVVGSRAWVMFGEALSLGMALLARHRTRNPVQKHN
jgi:uncharacterized membrane protein YbhN (UPF0104 family)